MAVVGTDITWCRDYSSSSVVLAASQSSSNHCTNRSIVTSDISLMRHTSATTPQQATELEADAFIILTDGGGVWHNFGKPDAKVICSK